MENNIKLNIIASSVNTDLLKPLGYKKRHNSFNRKSKDGVIQVINFQASSFNLEKDKNPILKQVPYGLFTINLGVYIPEVGKIIGYNKKEDFINEYDCQIRQRIGKLSHNKDYWLSLDENLEKVTQETLQLIEQYGVPFLKRFEDRDLILQELEKGDIYTIAPIPNIVASIICLKRGNMDRALKLLQQHYDNVKPELKGHIEYVEGLATKLGLKLKIKNK